MKKSSLTLEEILKLHQAGNLDQAKEDYIAWINDHQHETFGVDSLSVALAFNNLGTIYFAEANWQQAIFCYQSAIDLHPRYLDAYYNLGLALIRCKRNKEAIDSYQSLLLLAPTHWAGRFQLACLLMSEHQYEDASFHFSQILNDHPSHVESMVNLASCLLKMGEVNQAKKYYQQSLSFNPNDTQVLFNLGVISMQQGKIDDAINYYSRIVAANANFAPAHQNLGALFLAIKKKDRALAHFHEVIKLEPDNQSIAHLIHVISQDKPLSFSPLAYIRTLFDSYADHYDSHLTHTLQYQVPECFFHAFTSIYPEFPAKQLDILDLGCGTGLCGSLFKQGARSLTGIDISKEMLAIASQKKIYDALVEDDILSFLSDKVALYDLILAGDVLVYFGDLTGVFSAITKALRDKGFFIFNTEITQQKDYALKESGRFAHRKTYIEALSQTYGFTVLHHQVSDLRKQDQESVKGHLFILQKT